MTIDDPAEAVAALGIDPAWVNVGVVTTPTSTSRAPEAASASPGRVGFPGCLGRTFQPGVHNRFERGLWHTPPKVPCVHHSCPRQVFTPQIRARHPMSRPVPIEPTVSYRPPSSASKALSRVIDSSAYASRSDAKRLMRTAK